MGRSIMKEFIQTIIAMMRKMIWFGIFVIVVILSTVKNIFSIDVISDYGLDQYWRNIYQFQIVDIYYQVKKTTAVYEDPVLIADINYIIPSFTLEPGKVFAATGFYVPGNDVCWLAIEMYDGNSPVQGYVLEPGGCLGLFGAYINEDIRFDQFLGYEEEWYQDKLMDQFYHEISSRVKLYTATNNMDREYYKESGNYNITSDFIRSFRGIEKGIYSPEITYFVKSEDYILVKDTYNNYFETDAYIQQLTQI